jgi:hypothetical protein
MTQRELAMVINAGERFVVELEAGKSTSQLGKALAAAQAVGMQISGSPLSQPSRPHANVASDAPASERP